MDGSTVVASADLNSSTVVKESGEYYITLTGFNFLVKKGEKKQLVIKADVMPSIDSTDRTTLSSISVTIPANGVRGIDGAGIDQYGPTSALTGRSVTFSAELAETATLKLSLNSSTPKKAEVVAASGASENELDKLTTLVFDVKAEKDAVTVKDMRISVQKTGSGAATATTAYLFDGSTEIDSTTITNGIASFTDVDLTVAKDSTKTLTVKVDIRSANGTVANFITTASTTVSADLLSENSKGDSVTESGSAVGYQIGVRNVGAEVTLVSKSITTSGAPQSSGSSNLSTSTMTATFNVKVKAVGGDVLLGTAASTTNPFFAATGASPSFKVYRNGSVDATVTSAATSSSFTIPSCVSTGTNTCLLSEGTEVTFPITLQLQGRKATGVGLDTGLYAIQLSGLNWVANGTTATATFMDAEADWRTTDVSFP